jgi:hypothetical protein
VDPDPQPRSILLWTAPCQYSLGAMFSDSFGLNLNFFAINSGRVVSSVADPDPPDPHVFGPPGSGSTSQRYGSGSGSFYHHAEIVRKTLIPTIL